MAEFTLDTDPTKVQVQSPKAETRVSPAAANVAPAARVRPAELKLTCSLSKSDSDLLCGEEDGALVGRCESVRPSFASEWDEVMLQPALAGGVWRQEGGWNGKREWHSQG